MTNPLYPYPVATIRSIVADLTHPADLAEVIEAVSERVEHLHNGAEAPRLVSLTHGALQSLEDAQSTLQLVAEDMPDADFERAARVGGIRRGIARMMRAVA